MFNRSLWSDEAWLALNVIEKPLTQLVGRLDFNQAAPVGFVLTEGLAGAALGFSEYALRLFPLVCGLLSLPAFVWLARRMLARSAVPLAVLLFVVADGLVYFSSELKPYETDVAAALGLLIAGILVKEHASRLSWTRAVVLACTGLALLVFSFPAIFVVAAVAATLVTWWALCKRGGVSVAAAFVVLSWLAAATGIVIFAAARVRFVRESFELSSGSFLGVAGGSSLIHAVNAMGTNIAQGIEFPQTRPFSQVEKLALLCAVVGALALLRRNWVHFSMLVLPFPLLLVASAVDAYPISTRTELFLVPTVLLTIAEGVYQLVRWMPTRVQFVVAPLLVGVIAAGPVWSAASHVVHPRTHEEIRPVLEFVRDHWRPGDTLYVHYGAQPALLYYEECRCVRLSFPNSSRPLWPLEPLHGVSSKYSPAARPLTSDVILGRSFGGTDPGPYVNDLKRIEGRRRVWFLYSHLNVGGEETVVQAMLRRLDSIGTRVNRVDRKKAHAYIYELAGTRR